MKKTAKKKRNTTVGKLAWLCHHGELIELLTEPMITRREYIRKFKPDCEVATRLKWFRLVKNPRALPKEYRLAVTKLRRAIKTRDAHKNRRDQKYHKLSAVVYAAHTNVYTAYGKCMGGIEKLHRKECPGCPWDYKGQTLLFYSSVR